MSARKKAVVVIAIATVVLAGGLYLLLRGVVLTSFLRLEEENARRDVDRARAAITDDAAGLHATCRDYAVWDETYAFAGGEGPDYVKVNWVGETFAQNRLNLVVVVDGAGRKVFERGFDLAARRFAPPPDGLTMPAGEAQGLTMTARGPMLIAAHPILPSVRTGTPRGLLVMGRFLDDAEVARLGRATSLALSVTPGTAAPPLTRLDDRRLAAQAVLHDVGGAPILAARVDAARDVYARGLTGVRTLGVAVGVAALAFGAIVLLLFDRLVLRATFGRYVSEHVAKAILASPEAAALGGETRVVTILFSDLRSYSTIAERMRPEEVLALLNEYFTAMSEVIGAEEGVVLELVGDGMLAVFGAPAELPDHAERAVRAAIAMHAREDELNRAWEASGRAAAWRARGVDGVTARIGLHTGQVVVGNLGSETRMKYTVIGDAVNLAARIESLNGKLGTDLLLSEEVRTRLGPELAARAVDRGQHLVKGRDTPVRVYTMFAGLDA